MALLLMPHKTKMAIFFMLLLLPKMKMVIPVLPKTKVALLLQPKTKMAILLLLNPGSTRFTSTRLAIPSAVPLQAAKGDHHRRQTY